MKTNYSKYKNEFLYTQATVKKGQLDEADLIYQGQQLIRTQTDRKVRNFFKLIYRLLEQKLINRGWKEAPKENYFAKKSIKVIHEINKNKLTEKLGKVSQAELTHYLSLLKRGEVLIQHSSHWHQIQFLHRSYAFIQETEENFQTHWLKSFMSAADLAQISSLQSEEQTQLLELHALQNEWTNPDFVPILQFIADETEIFKLSPEQMQNLKLCLTLYRDLSSQNSEKRFDKTVKLFQILQEIEKDKGKEASIEFYAFLQAHSNIQDLLLRLPRGSSADMLQLPQLIAQLSSSLPSDLPLSQTLEEGIQKLKDALPENKGRVLAERWGRRFAHALIAIQDQQSLQEPLQKLQDIEESFRLCGKTPRFIQLLQEAMGTESFKNRQELEKVIEKFQSQDPLLVHLITRVSAQTHAYLQLGVDSRHIHVFQQLLIDEIESTTTQFITRYVDGKEGIDKKIAEATQRFNLEQLQKAKQQWAIYGEPFVEQVMRVMGPQVASGEIHYKQNSQKMPDLAEMDRLFVQLGVNQLKVEYGTTFATHTVHYLLSPEGKKHLETHPDYIQTEWPAIIQQLAEVKQQFQKQSVSGSQFEQALHQFLTQSPYAIFHDGEFLFDTSTLEQFSWSLQRQLNEQKLSDFARSHGLFFQKILKDYLKEQEVDVLVGKKPLEDVEFFHVTPFSEQVRLFLLPYIFEGLEPLDLLDEKIILDVLLKDSLTPENFQIRLNQLQEFKKFATHAANPREKTFVREILRHFHPYLITHASSSEKDKKMAQEIVLKLVKFCCREVDEKSIYTPDLLAKAILELVKVENGSVYSLQQIYNIADKCDEFFNGKIKDKFKAVCFHLYLEDIAKQACQKLGQEGGKNIDKLVESLQTRFTSMEEGLSSPQARDYVQDMIGFAVHLSLEYSLDYFTVVDFFSQEITKKTIFFDLKKINQQGKNLVGLPSYLKEKMISQAQKMQGAAQTEENNVLSVLKRNPFSLVQAFAPRFIENLLADEDKNQVEDIRKALIPLGPLVNQSANVNWAIEQLSHVMALIPEADKTTSVKETLYKQILILNNLKLDAMVKCLEPDQYKDTISQQGLGLLAIGIRFISNQLINAHRDVHTNPKADDAVVNFIRQTLPKVAEDRQTIIDWIKRIADWIPLIRRIGGGWIANKILKRYLSSKLDSLEALDPHSKKIIITSLESIIRTVLLATPALIKHHDIDRYLAFFDNLNTLMQKKETPDGDVIFMEILKIIQQLTQEVTAYGPLVEEAINHAEQTLKLS